MTVSVIIPTCGRFHLLNQAIQSVRKQSVMCELIVVIDGDCYNEEQEKEIKEKADFVLHVNPNGEHKHVAVALNAALDKSSCDFIAYLGDDNLYVNDERLQYAIDCLSITDNIAYADQARWLRIDGMVVSQKTIGNYQYPKPHVDSHNKMIGCVAKTGTNFLVHDCVVHWKTELRYNISQNYNDKVCPIDWDYWCRLVSKGSFCCVNEVGVEAFMPGAWRSGLTENDALKVRGQTMGKMARNVSGKIQVIPSNGMRKQIVVPKDGLVDEDFVLTNAGALFPGFVIDFDNTPRVDFSSEVEEKKIEEKKVTKNDLNGMTYGDLLRTAELMNVTPKSFDEDSVKEAILRITNPGDKKEYIEPDFKGEIDDSESSE